MAEGDGRPGRGQGGGAESLQRVVWGSLVEAGVEGELRGESDDQGVTVGRRFGDELHADVAAGPAPVVDHDLMLEILTESL